MHGKITPTECSQQPDNTAKVLRKAYSERFKY